MMANAIHQTEAGETLVRIAQLYYALHHPDGSVRQVELRHVTSAIRDATPTPLTRVADTDALPAGKTLFIPTLRALNRVVFADHAALSDALQAHGFDHACKLLRYPSAQIITLLRPLPAAYTEQDVRRAWMLTALLNLDGMDRYTATYLCDEVGIRSLNELARQSQATLDSVLQTLIAPPHSRPPELAAQDHASRWIVSAKIIVRRRVGELTKIKHRYFQVPFSPSVARRRAEFYEAAAADDSFTAEEATLAAHLGKLYRFQAALLRGNIGVRSGNWAEAVAGYQEARRQWHRLAETTGAIASGDDDGLNLNTCIAVTRRLLEALPSNDDHPLGAPILGPKRGGVPTRYRLRGFRYDELASAPKQQLRGMLATQQVHRLPRRTRSAIQQATLEKTRIELRTANPALTAGLIAGADATLARDLEAQDREVLRRNLGASPIRTLYHEEAALHIFERVGDSLALSDIPSLLPDHWTIPASDTPGGPGQRAVNVLSDGAKAQYPAAFLSRADVTPATKFLVVPGEAGSATDRFVPLTASFAGDYEQEILKPRLTSSHAEDLLFDEAVWSSVGAFAAMAPYAYAAQIPLGLRMAYSKLNQPAMARQFGGVRVNFYNGDGTLAREAASLNPAKALAFDPDLLACSTGFTGFASVSFPWHLLNYAETWIPIADYAYRQEDRDAARSYYADVRCAIEKFFPDFASRAGLALTGVLRAIQSINTGTFAGTPETRKLQNLTTFDVAVVRNDEPRRIMDGIFLVVRGTRNRSRRDPSSVRKALQPYFDVHVQWNPDTGEVTAPSADVVDTAPDPEPSGRPVLGWDIQIYVDHDQSIADPLVGASELYRLYLYCVAKMQAIDAGLNWYGFSAEFVPPWSFDHLYHIARDLCNRALEAEQRVFTLLQMYQTADEKEFLANQAEELAGAQLAVAKAKVEQQVANNQVAIRQALLSVEQADAQAKKSGLRANIVLATTAVVAAAAAVLVTVGTGGAAGAAGAGAAAAGAGGAAAATGGSTAAAIGAGASAAVGPLAGLAGNLTGHAQDVDVLNRALEVSAAVMVANQTALNVAIAERDVAALQAEQASEYVDFLATQTLNSDAYLYLMGLAKEVLETYIHHANRMAWLAERALEHETRQGYALIAIDYTTQDELADMTRAQRITADLEALRSEYVAGQTARLQEVKWTIALSELDPIAWQDLRQTGTCTFVLRQRMLDMYFPGLYQHRLKDVRLEIVGLVSPEGARGVLTTPGVSWVRVPNEQPFLADQTEADWVTTSLEGSATFDTYDQYVMKRGLTSVVTLTLSQFDVRADRAVLAAPQGMLTPVQHLGLDSAWTLKLHRQSNNFDFKGIVDAEFTFWFLGAYDAQLEQAQVNALTEEGVKGWLTGVSRTAFMVHQPQSWAAFVSRPADGEALDLRYLAVDVANLPPWERDRRLTNVLLACARMTSQTEEVTLRLLCDHDPVGYQLTTTDGAIYSLIGVDTSKEEPPPKPDADFESWVKEALYLKLPDIDPPDQPGDIPGPPGDLPGPPKRDRYIPFKSPEIRWVIKAAPAQVGAGWLREDDDGRAVSTASGPLQGWAGGTARYSDGEGWADLTLQVKVAHRHGTLRLRLRDDGTDAYALQIAPTAITLLKVQNGSDTQLGERLAYAYPPDEYLLVEFSVVGERLSVAIDGITLFTNVDGAPAPGQLRKGTVAFEVVATDDREPVGFDDVRVFRLTGKGVAAETLLSEPFTRVLPQDWSFTDGSGPWAISDRGHHILDFSRLLNVVLHLDYRHQMNRN